MPETEKTITATELARHTGEILALVERGTVVKIVDQRQGRTRVLITRYEKE
jgi:hypothetical protein